MRLVLRWLVVTGVVLGSLQALAAEPDETSAEPSPAQPLPGEPAVGPQESPSWPPLDGAPAAQDNSFPAPLPEGASQPAAAFPPPPVAPMTQSWPDSDHASVMVMRGGMGVCRGVLFPLQLLPNVGMLLAMAGEWLCVPPTAVAVDYTQRAHGTRRGRLWEALTSTGVAKLWRDFTDIPVVLNFLALTLGVSSAAVTAVVLGTLTVALTNAQNGAASAQLSVAFTLVSAFAPLAVSASVTYAALVFLGLGLLKDPVGEFLFGKLYAALSSNWPDQQAQWKDQHSSIIRPALSSWERAWMLATVASGTGPAFSLLHLIPLAGPMVKGFHKYQAIKANIRRLAVDDFREPTHDHERVEYTLAALLTLEAAITSLGHLAILLNVALVGMGFGAAILATRPELDRFQLQPLALASGVTLAALSTVALFLLVLKDAPMALTPVLVPLAYGLVPDGSLMPARE